MIAHAQILASDPIRFAPFSALLAGLIKAVPRYDIDKHIPDAPRSKQTNAHRTAFAVMLQSKLYALLVDNGPMLTQHIREQTGIANTTVYNNLDALYDEGKITRKKIVNGVIWSVVK